MMRFILGGLMIVAGLIGLLIFVPASCGMACVGISSPVTGGFGFVIGLLSFVLIFAGGYLMRTTRRR
jgi:hypothetical protein